MPEHFTRGPVNVPDLLARDRIIRRFAAIRAEAMRDKATIEHWNWTHPNEPPISTAFEVATIAWCEGKGPPPELPHDDA